MARLSVKTIEENVAPLGRREAYDRGILFELLLAYGRSPGNVTRLRNGSLSVADDPTTEVAQKGVVWFRETTDDLLAVIDDLKTAPSVVRYRPRFVIVTDYTELAAIDTKTGENLYIALRDIDRHVSFFLPWAGMEKAQYIAEAHADVKAAERMGKLFDELLGANPGLLDAPRDRHGLNVFFARLLFCFFAEDTGIFTEGQFTRAVGSHTQPDGFDTAEFLAALFTALDTADAADKPPTLAAFPYVNGRLFAMGAGQVVPRFTKAARALLLDLGSLNWSKINPDIFGSMFQAVVNPSERSNLGQHYTSVPNILKTIEPLFLDDLREQLDVGFDSVRKLEALLDRISAIKVFDPACGSGNFLVIAYKELRKLEHAILERLAQLSEKHQTLFAESRISIEHFYGIELADFAAEIAVLSLWIAKHQMNVEFKEKFNLSIPLIPLKETGQIRQGNAARVDWREVCPNDGSEIYLIGNPPYKGAKKQTKEMKADLSCALAGRSLSRNLNYVAVWFVKGAVYIARSKAELAFITTNSVSQGEHVGLMFPEIFGMDIEIGYAYTSFKWGNSAKGSAQVTVAVISLRPTVSRPKYLFELATRRTVRYINGYLAEGSPVFIGRRSSVLGSARPEMVFGSMPRAKGLVVAPEDYTRMLERDIRSANFLKPYIGTDEFLQSRLRYCIWISDSDSAQAERIEEIAERLQRVKAERLESKAPSTIAFAEKPYRFAQISYRSTESIIVPSVSSELRDYIPIGYLGPGTVTSNLAFAIYDASVWLFGLLTSRMHMQWARAVGGQHETRLRYSNTIVYNNFPVPPLSEATKEALTIAALRVLDVREYHCERTLAELYDPDLMPDDLRAAHAEVDKLVDALYSKRGYETDEQRLSDLFAMYEAMTAEEAAKTPAKKARKTR